jgi:predicted transposase/invertase (TIGR01784 family)
MNIKPFDDLDITDPIMFGLVFSNKHIAQPFIEHLLDIKIDHLETPVPEAVLSYDAEHKGVRYDVFARETNENGETIRSFDLEMQMVDTKELPQRARYYQSVGDGVALSKGGYYTSLKEQYIIFLCPMDIFECGFPVYHFENRAKENPSITLNDLSYKNFYIFTKYREFSDPVVKAYMKYFATRNVDSHETEAINSQVSFYKTDTIIRNKYMTYEYDLHESKEEGRAEGKVEGKTEARLEMVDAMLANSKFTDEDIASVSRIPLEEIQKRRALRKQEL